ncbi:MAG: class I SAM-dependent methyltransferase [Dysgonamonadaceae bacterium]|jgi:SAM-dependent methyltransferase|nr:class I SAM-dependent methyltransferase [Dysgonamonadaceae bacterium]
MNAQTISRNNRIGKYNLFLEKMKPSATDKILDVGYSNLEYSLVDNFLEKNYPYPSNITALGIEDNDLFKQRYPNIQVVRYDGSIFPFEDKSFDIGWSNAVIEHVGNEGHQIQFLKELCRTCKKIYFTTPNRYFPFEVHTRYPLIHWLPKKLFDKILSLTSKKWAAGDYMNLLSKKSLENILQKVGLEEKYVLHRNKFWGFTLDFSVIIT